MKHYDAAYLIGILKPIRSKNRSVLKLAKLDGISYGEIKVTALVNPKYPNVEKYLDWKDPAEAGAAGWLERWKGRWLQNDDRGGGTLFKIKNEIKEEMASLSIKPNGYADTGKFYL